MRIALIADVHGNSIALDAVASRLEQEAPDEVVFLGDAVVNGFDPVGALQRLRQLGCRTVMGNTDADILDTPEHYHLPGRAELPEAAQRVLEIALWGHDQLAEDDRRFLVTFEPTLQLPLPGQRTLLCFHGSPRSATDVITSTTTEAALDPMLGETTAAVFAGGHTHVQLVRQLGRGRFVNPGAVGLPFARYGGAGTVPVRPCAQYAIVDATADRLAIRLDEVPLDLAGIQAAARDSGMPHAAWWAALWQEDEA